MIVVSLIEEDVFPVLHLAIDRILFEDTGGADAMFLAQLFPELASNLIKMEVTLIPALPDLDCDYLSRHLLRLVCIIF